MSFLEAETRASDLTTSPTEGKGKTLTLTVYHADIYKALYLRFTMIFFFCGGDLVQ